MTKPDNSVELMRAKRKARAILAARFSLRRQLERIDYDLDVIRHAMSEIDSDAANGTLPALLIESEVSE